MFKLNFVKNIIKNIDKKALLIGIIVIVVIVAGALVYAKSNNGFNWNFSFGMSNDEIAKKAIDYINNNGLAQSAASLVSVSEESGLVKMRIKIGADEFDSYVTKDGKFLFPTALKMEGNKNSESQSDQPSDEQIKQTCDTMKKTANPAVEAYIVSQCPYGLQMQRVLADVVKNIPDLAQNIFVRYMGAVSNGKITSMHGDEEAQENLRQICIRDEQRSKYWNYVSCYIKAGDSSGCSASTGIDKSKLSSCMTDSSRGLAYAKEDFNLNDKYSVQGSPTLILNGEQVSEFDFGGRSSEAIKTLICCASSSQPGFCSTELNTASAAPSFSETYEGSGSSGSASCE